MQNFRARISGNALLQGILYSILGALFISSKAIFAKLSYHTGTIDGTGVLTLRMLFALPFYIIIAWYSSRKQDYNKLSPMLLLRVLLLGCLGYYLSSLFDFIGLQYVSAGLERLIIFIYPSFVVLFGAMFLQQKINKWQAWALLLTYAGVGIAYWAEGLDTPHHPKFLWGTFLIFLCTLSYAVYFLLSGRILKRMSAQQFASFGMISATVAIAIHYGVTRQGFAPLLHLPTTVYVYCLLMAVIATVIPSYLIAEGLKRIGSGNAAIVSSLGPVATTIQAVWFLGEPFSWLQAAGTVMVLLGIGLITKQKND